MPLPRHPLLRPSRFALLALAAAGLAALPAGAAESAKPPAKKAVRQAPKPAAPPAGKTVGTGPLLTREQLRECMAQQDRNRADASALEAEAAKVNEEKAQLVKQGDELKAQLETLDRSSAEAVDKYNAQASARDAAIDAFNTRTTDFNSRLQAAQDLRAAYAKTCENRSYDERDEKEIRAGK